MTVTVGHGKTDAYMIKAIQNWLITGIAGTAAVLPDI